MVVSLMGNEVITEAIYMRYRGKGRADADEWNTVRLVTGIDLRQANRLAALALVGETCVA